MLININEQDYKLHFGCTSVELFYKEAGALSADAVFNARLFAKIVWAGLLNEAERQDRPLTLSYADVYDWVDKRILNPKGQAELAGIVKAFQESQAVKDAAASVNEGAKKKKKSTLTN